MGPRTELRTTTSWTTPPGEPLIDPRLRTTASFTTPLGELTTASWTTPLGERTTASRTTPLGERTTASWAAFSQRRATLIKANAASCTEISLLNSRPFPLNY